MPVTNTLDFSTPAGAEKALKKIGQLMGRAGQPIASSEFNQKARRSSDTTYREAYLTLISGQQVTLRVNATGDIYQVLLNNAVKPLKEHTDTEKAVLEIAAMAEKNQAAFQKAQARKAVALPKSMTTPKPKIADSLVQEVASLDARIADRQATLAGLRSKLGLASATMTDSVDNPLLVLASAYVAARELGAASGIMLDGAKTDGAKGYLEIALDIVETNMPINLERGDIEQARLQMNMAESFKAALVMLDSASSRPMDDVSLAQLVDIAKASAASEDEIGNQDALATLLALGMVDVADGIYFLSEKGRQCLNDNGMDAYGEPFGE